MKKFLNKLNSFFIKIKYLWNSYVLRYFPSFFKLLWTFMFFSVLTMIFAPVIISGMIASGAISYANPDVLNAVYYLTYGNMYMVMILTYLLIIFYIIGMIIALFFKPFKGKVNNYHILKEERAKKICESLNSDKI